MSDWLTDQPFAQAPALAEPDRQARTWAVLAHVLPMVAFFVSLGCCSWLPPLLILVSNRRESFAGGHARESLNFRLTLLLPWVVLFVVLWSLPLERWFPGGAGFYLYALLFLVIAPFAILIWGFELVSTILATRQASAGKAYRYPLTVRFVRRPAGD